MLGHDLQSIAKLHRTLQRAGIPFRGLRGDLTVDFLPEATPEQRTLAAQLVAAHDPVDDEGQRKRDAIAALEGINFKAWADAVRASSLPTTQKAAFLRINKVCWLLTTTVLGLAADDPGE